MHVRSTGKGGAAALPRRESMVRSQSERGPHREQQLARQADGQRAGGAAVPAQVVRVQVAAHAKLGRHGSAKRGHRAEARRGDEHIHLHTNADLGAWPGAGQEAAHACV